jgi:hypothetical protein
MKKGKEVIISSPSSPAEIVNAIFNSADEDDPHAAVFQQELIIACADLVFTYRKNFIFKKILDCP